MPQTLGIL